MGVYNSVTYVCVSSYSRHSEMVGKCCWSPPPHRSSKSSCTTFLRNWCDVYVTASLEFRHCAFHHSAVFPVV